MPTNQAAGSAEPSTTDADQTAAAADPASKVRDELAFNLLRTALYHDHRERRLIAFYRALTFGSLVFGTSAFGAIAGGWPLFGEVAAMLVAVFSASSLVYDHAGRAGAHKDLKRRSYTLLADFEADRRSESAIQRDLTLLYADEPPISEAVSALAHNQAGTALFGDDPAFKRIALSRWTRIWSAILPGVEFALADRSKP